jgi:hypothetical protein
VERLCALLAANVRTHGVTLPSSPSRDVIVERSVFALCAVVNGARPPPLPFTVSVDGAQRNPSTATAALKPVPFTARLSPRIVSWSSPRATRSSTSPLPLPLHFTSSSSSSSSPHLFLFLFTSPLPLPLHFTTRNRDRQRGEQGRGTSGGRSHTTGDVAHHM